MTAKLFSDELELTIETLSGLSELDRGNKFFSEEEYLNAVQRSLSFPPLLVQGWEHPEDALNRFKSALSSISLHECERILIVSHGLVISLFMTSLLNMREDAFNRWKNLKFLSWGEIIGNTIVRDIV